MVERPAVLAYAGAVSRPRLLAASRCMVLIGLVSMAAIGCRHTATGVCPTSIEDARQHALTAVQAAALRWWLGLREPPHEGGWLFVDGDDARAELLAQLHQRDPVRHEALRSWIVPRSLALVDDNGVAHHSETGEQGAILAVGSIEFSSPTSAGTNVDFTGCGDLCGSNSEVFVLCDESGWRVYDTGRALAY